MKRISLAVAAWLLLLPLAIAGSLTPQPGSKLRAALMDAIRASDYYPDLASARRNADNILYKVDFLRVKGGWALANVTPLKDGREHAEPRWCLLRRIFPEEWRVVDYYALVSKYYKDDADFFSAIDMDKRAVGYVRKELPQIPPEIFP